MLKALLSVRMAALASWFTGGGRTKKPRSKAAVIGFALLMLYSIGALGFMFWFYFSTMAAPLHALGLDWLFFSLVGIAAFSLVLLGTVFFAKAQLYEARDNELLLSMPIKPGCILLSRMAMLLVIAVVFLLPVVVPAAIAGLRFMEPGAGEIACFAVLFLLLPVFALAAAALCGWLFSVLTARVKNKAVSGALLCVSAMAVYSLLVAKVNTSIAQIATYAGGLARSLGAFAPVYWFGAAVGEGRLDYTLAVACIFIAVAALTYALLSATFIRTATSRRGFAKTRYVERETAAASPDKALLRREFARLTSSSVYMVNAGLGLVFMVAAAGALLIKGDALKEALAALPDAGKLLPAMLLAGTCALTGMNLISAPAVSLEGRNLWIVRSLPVEAWQVLRAKVRMHLRVCLPPVLLLSLVCALSFDMTPLQRLLMLAVPVLMTVFIGILGVAENLRHPNLDWTNETQAVKSNLGVLFTMLISWGVVGLPVLAVVLTGRLDWYEPVALILSLALIAASLALRRWLYTRGAERFRQL